MPAGYAGGPVLSGEFVLQLAATVAPLVGVLGTALGAWLHARYGRKVRLRIGDIEAEGQNIDDVNALLRRAVEFQQASQPKLIH